MRRYLVNIPRASFAGLQSRPQRIFLASPRFFYSTETSSTETTPPPEVPYDQLSSYAKLRHDLKAAMRNRDMKTVNTVKSVLTDHQSTVKEIKRKDPDTPDPYLETDKYLVPVIYRQISKRQDSIQGYKEHHRQDLVETEEFEIDVLRKYLPEPQTTAEDVRKMVVEGIEVLRESGRGANDPASMGVGRIMNWLREDKRRTRLLAHEWADQAMVKRVVAETVRDLSDRPDGLGAKNVQQLKKPKKDTLTKERYQ